MLTEPPISADERTVPAHEFTRGQALAQVILCSGFPTQLLIAAGLASVGIRPGPAGELSPTFVFLLSTLDTVLLLALVFLFLRRSGESAHALFIGERRVVSEIALGVGALPAVFALVIAIQSSVHVLAPSLRNVQVSPFTPLLSSPWLVAGFIVLVLVAGGIREELQRAFLLHRFEQRLGGGRIGLLITSTAFGIGHTVQGWDAALITGLLGASWGAVYLSRRSAVGTVANHALFNVTQVVLAYAALTRA